MKCLLNLFFLATLGSVSSEIVPKSNHPALFGVRGGGLFGGGSKDEISSDDTATGDLKKYPAMSQEEIEDWLAHIPVYAITDTDGNGVVLKPDESSSVFYFFMNPIMANQTLTTLKGNNEDMNLRVSTFSLGRIWFKVLRNSGDGTEIKLKQPGADDSTASETVSNVEYRLVPDTRDLLGARMLLTMDPADSTKEMTQETAQKAMEKAMTESPKFNTTFNEIPVFMIGQMRMQKQPEEGSDDEPVTLLPMYFNLQNMVAIWQQFTAQSPDAQGVEPAINLLDLYEMVEKMGEESEIDFRNVVLIPSAPPGADGGAPGSAQQPAAAAASDGIQMPGATLGDL